MLLSHFIPIKVRYLTETIDLQICLHGLPHCRKIFKTDGSLNNTPETSKATVNWHNLLDLQVGGQI